MIYISPEYVISSTLSIGAVYKLTAPELISTTIPHYFIVVAIENDDNYLVLCTTQLNSKLNYFQRNGLDLNTLVYLVPSTDNGLTNNTYVNCNDYYHISKSSLISKVQSDILSVTGKVSEDEYNLIASAIKLSHTNDLPDYLLIYS